MNQLQWEDLDKRRVLYTACGVAAGLPPLGLDIGAYGTLLWFLCHDEALRQGVALSTEDAMAVLGAAAPELAWALVGAPGLKWLSPLVGMGIGAFFNVAAARNVVVATRLYLASGRRLRGHALRQELEEYRAAERKRRKQHKQEERAAARRQAETAAEALVSG